MLTSTGHISTGPSRRAIAAVAALALMALLAFAASASAETPDLVAVANSVEDVASPQPPPPSAEPPPAPAEPMEAPEAAAAATAVADDLAPKVRTEPDADVPSGGIATGSAERIRESVSKVTVPATRSEVTHYAETAARAVERARSPVDRNRVRALAGDLLRAAGESLRDLPGGAVVEEATGSLLSLEGPSETATGPLSPSTAPRLPDHLPTATHPPRRISLSERGEGMPRRRYLETRGSSEPLPVEPSNVAANLEGASRVSTADALLVSLGSGDAHSENPAPLDGDNPLPSPGSLPVTASGSSGSPFAPIVALLALLALAVPAILRRLEEAPDPMAPSLFACALERPG